ncbi:hypothetical protein D3C87_1711920 [compost metagenome]
MEGAFAQPHQFADVGDFKLRGLLVKQVKDLQCTFNRLNDRHNGGLSTLKLRRKRTLFTLKNQSTAHPLRVGEGQEESIRTPKTYLPSVATITALMVCMRFSA